jgi:lysophospholipase L1-like esterase
MGYSPEQYYYSLIAFADRFRPQFVVVSVFANDFGDMREVTTKGAGDWKEGKYWLEQIAKYCQARRWPYVIVAAPYELNLLGRRNAGFYPGTISNLLDVESVAYLDPFEDFANAHLRLKAQDRRKGTLRSGSPIFNDVYNDIHLSAAGAEVWAEAVGRRLILLLDREGGPKVQTPTSRGTAE